MIYKIIINNNNNNNNNNNGQTSVWGPIHTIN